MQMVQLSMNTRQLYRWAHEIDLPTPDEGYLVHYALRSCFGEAGPQPFAVVGRTGNLKVLGYADQDKTGLSRQQAMLAEPLLAEAMPAGDIHSKALPDTWPEGSRFGFRVRCCPVTRLKENGNRREKDYYLAACDRNPDGGLDRAEVYSQWLEGELARDQAAKLVTCSMKEFKLVKPVRKGAGKPRARRLGGLRPDAVFEGILEIMDPSGFASLLRRGIGRHRAFGYGMILLRPVKG
jgi:CRISPR system Cascade subunit CasE